MLEYAKVDDSNMFEENDISNKYFWMEFHHK